MKIDILEILDVDIIDFLNFQFKISNYQRFKIENIHLPFSRYLDLNFLNIMEKLGINALGITAQIANIAILLFIFKKFLYKPILKVLEKRQQSIEDNIRLQEQLEARLEALDEKERQMVKRAKVEANKIAEEVRTEAKTSANLLLVAARDEASSIRKQTREELKRELESNRQKLEDMMAKKAAEVANDAIGKLLGEKTRRLLTEKQVSEFVKKSHEP